MAGRFRKPRTIIISVIIVVLSVGIVFAALPLLQHPVGPHVSLRFPNTQTLGPGNSTNPGHAQLGLPHLTTNESFILSVSVSNGNATFCILDATNYSTWSAGNFRPSWLPPNSCVVNETTVQDTLTFVPSIAGDWYIVALNTSQKTLTVTFSPA
jgi:hypothetical protein